MTAAVDVTEPKFQLLSITDHCSSRTDARDLYDDETAATADRAVALAIVADRMHDG